MGKPQPCAVDADVNRTHRTALARWLLCVALLSCTAHGQDSAVVKLVSAALQYVSTSAGPPAAPPLPDINVSCTCENSSRNGSAGQTTVLASVQTSAAPQLNATRAARRNLRPCGALGQQQRFPGSWQDSPDPDYQGEYDMTLDCPKWMNDYDCHRPPENAHIDPNLVRCGATPLPCVFLKQNSCIHQVQCAPTGRFVGHCMPSTLVCHAIASAAGLVLV